MGCLTGAPQQYVVAAAVLSVLLLGPAFATSCNTSSRRVILASDMPAAPCFVLRNSQGSGLVWEEAHAHGLPGHDDHRTRVMCFDLTRSIGRTPEVQPLALCSPSGAATSSPDVQLQPQHRGRQWAHRGQLIAQRGQAQASSALMRTHMGTGLALASMSTSACAITSASASDCPQSASPGRAWAAGAPPLASTSSSSPQPASSEGGSAAGASSGEAGPRFPPWKKLGVGPPSYGARNKTSSTSNPDAAEATPGSLAVECSGGRRKVYRARGGQDAGARAWEGFEIVEERKTSEHHVRDLIQSYLLPQVRGWPCARGAGGELACVRARAAARRACRRLDGRLDEGQAGACYPTKAGDDLRVACRAPCRASQTAWRRSTRRTWAGAVCSTSLAAPSASSPPSRCWARWAWAASCR